MKVRCLVAVGSLIAACSHAQSLTGWGRITAAGGYRLVPNGWFEKAASNLGHPTTDASLGGGHGMLSFGYQVMPLLELAVDVFAAQQAFQVDPYGQVQSWSYGAVIGVRLQTELRFGLIPFIGVEAGVVVANMSNGKLQIPEKATGGVAAVGGLHVRVAPHWAITADVRWLYARSYFPDISGLNVGGLFIALGVTFLISPSSSVRGAPGFDAPSLLRE